jgi:exosortase
VFAEQDPLPRQMSLPIWGRAPRLSWQLVAVGLLMALLGVWATWRAWADAWSLVDFYGDNNHVFLAPLVAFWLFWVRRGRLAHVRVTGRWVGLALIIAGWLLRSHGLAQNIAAGFHMGSLLVVLGAFVSVCGKGAILRFLPAVVALMFLIPVPQRVRSDLAVPLQTTTAWMTDGVLDVMGVDSHLAGRSLVVNGRTVTIAEANHGMPMVFGVLLLAYAFAFAWPFKNSVRLLLLVLSPLVTLGCSVLRTIPLVWTYGNRVEDGFAWLHAYSSWLMLPVAFVMLLGVLRILRWLDVQTERYRLAVQ